MRQQSFYPTINGDILSRANLYKFLREFFRASSYDPGYYLEFGVYNGESMLDAYRMLRGYVTHYFGFDSFAGLPELSDRDAEGSALMTGFSPGLMKSMAKPQVEQNILALSGMDPTELTLTEGFFAESLKLFDHKLLEGKGQCLVCYVDCDLYSSTMEVLEFVEPLLVTGTWLLFDDYWTYRGDPKFGQRKALTDWLMKTSRIGVSDYSNFKGWGKAFIVHEK